ncbi:kielin/chordin-like protein [Pecten maximus]|uniref:kielin/chordin-like protein n=1 Tax=Pecten maximus TaxID=6579 RepID=UPI001458C4B2|nr:kielin/chordin-like protein [Pecten maximus]
MAVVKLFLEVTVLSAISAYVLDNRIVYPTPPGCSWEGKEYNHGDGINRDNCSMCECHMGQIVCMYPNCPVFHHNCVDVVTIKCGCHHCPNGYNCKFGNLTLQYGTDYRPDETTICSCVEGEYNAVCRPFGCEYQGKMYSEEIFHPSPCVTCRCYPHTNVQNCSLNACINKPLVCVDATVEAGTCCHVCPNGPNCFAGNRKIPAGIDYNDGGQICRCPEPNHEMHFGSSGPQAICNLVGPMAPPSSTTHPLQVL